VVHTFGVSNYCATALPYHPLRSRSGRAHTGRSVVERLRFVVGSRTTSKRCTWLRAWAGRPGGEAPHSPSGEKSEGIDNIV
jgi:hypothetical protein